MAPPPRSSTFPPHQHCYHPTAFTRQSLTPKSNICTSYTAFNWCNVRSQYLTISTAKQYMTSDKWIRQFTHDSSFDGVLRVRVLERSHQLISIPDVNNPLNSPSGQRSNSASTRQHSNMMSISPAVTRCQILGSPFTIRYSCFLKCHLICF